MQKMSAEPNRQFQRPLLRHHQSGFTLVELMVGLVVSTIVLIGAFSVHITTRQTVMTQRQVADMQQQLRGSLRLMEHDIRAAGYDPTGVGTPLAPLGIQDIRRYQVVPDPNPDPIAPGLLGPNEMPVLTVDFDMNADGVVEQHTYLLYDMDNTDTIDDLIRVVRVGGVAPGCIELVAEGIQAIGFAYAMDADLDDAVDRSPNGNIIWAVDSDNDNDLDRALDADDDGDIDINDLAAAPVNLPADVAVDRIRMVRIWLLSRSTRSAKKAIFDQSTYVVGDQIVPPPGDTFRRRTMEMIIKIRAT
jgi:type IV pilus assembly protein PilW